jgi:o-succinylbenzoate synthase
VLIFPVSGKGARFLPGLEVAVQISEIHIREIELPLVHYFETSFGRTTRRRIILTRVESEGIPGYGECTAGEDPLYSSETTDTAWHLLSDFLIPRLMQFEPEAPGDIERLFAPIRGHRMAKASLETAAWEMQARRSGRPLWQLIGGTRREIPCGVSIGIQESIGKLLSKVREETAAGYRRIKIKIKPGWEMEPIRAIRAEFPDLQLMVDANSAFTLEDIGLFRRIDDCGLMMIEQPLAHDDMVDHARLQKELQTPICLDESIHHADDARKAIEMGSCRIINVKLGRVGGFAEAIRINALCTRLGVPLWCGGMLESGIGRAHNIALSTLSGFTLPGDVSASRRYFAEDTVNPPVEVTPEGLICAREGPGIGYSVDWDMIARATVRERLFRKGREVVS